MDNRGQGTGNRVGDTGDAFSTGASAPGFLTSGIDSPETYYYRRLFTDAVRAVQVARRDPGWTRGASWSAAAARAARSRSRPRR